MIFVTRKEGENSQKTVSGFLKRVKKSNMVARARKTKFFNKKVSSRLQKIKKLGVVQWFKDNEFKNTKF
jgi:hypothetical protein